MLEEIRRAGLRATATRVHILQIFREAQQPLSYADVFSTLQRQGMPLNIATVHRVIDALCDTPLLHKHPSSGKFLACAHAGDSAHHGFLSCRKCGDVREFSSKDLCGIEHRIASSNGFTAEHHISDLVGLCSTCQ